MISMLLKFVLHHTDAQERTEIKQQFHWAHKKGLIFLINITMSKPLEK
jgi:hypothetical protein